VSAETLVLDGSSGIASFSLGDRNVVWANLVLLSLSTHRDANRVLGVGAARPLGLVTGPRVVGGSLAFTSFDRDAWEDALELAGLVDLFAQPDELPPFAIHCSIPINVQGAQPIAANPAPGFDFQYQLPSSRYAYQDAEGVVWANLYIEGVRLLESSVAIGADRVLIDQQYAFIATSVTRLRTRTGRFIDPTPGEDRMRALDYAESDGATFAFSRTLSSVGFRNQGTEYYDR
jgi:hypothetical protein